MHQQKSFESHSVGTLYLVPTPIGNLEDMTYRAVHILQSVDIIASEDTRHTQKLLNHFSIHTPQKSLHEHNVLERVPQLVELLQKGANIAQVSDAGMPSISDPGHELVQACIAQGIPVVSLPGASAGLTALIASGLSPKQFYFHGFLPRKKQEQVALFQHLLIKEETLIFYESPFRIKKTLHAMAEVFHHKRQVVLCRELTKRHEEYIRGHLSDLIEWAETHEIKGECCVLVSGCLPEEKQDNLDTQKMPEYLSIIDQVAWVMEKEQLSQKDAIKKVAKYLGKTKQDIYKIVHGG
ncbi:MULTISPECIES: 16S rRNA (cytidine(1402)-2'-O)-methyltransferase [unclassified Granulicatella]|uniref:16S rRNA (cytidine(1402)-2'-O)-methyltransferase n=1 Tax=unclassified Granulicatella TaxID=2630493 RepID=UPI001883EF25|nr:16S rRNA (cytidine(1402)-2'-O)-methyltransferase [Granulicatella sp. WM01]MBF0780390.1 16S rRNA (cytidine(1402)-2'-O)-methyltransferase [Granulicatella sp. 19428wC4_WM01]